jgi:MoaA/NifB/PqqE/SkfB family radical SAM enzyme
MRVRIEQSGLHLFDRRSGTHILLDDVVSPEQAWSVAPRTMSIAVSNRCDLACNFCYRPRTADSLSAEFVHQLAESLATLGALEITFGGGEPLLEPSLPLLCEWIWEETPLGVSLTTHGHRLTPALLAQLRGHVSSLRFSIDGLEPYYSQIRARPLQRLIDIIRRTGESIPFGINVVVSPGHVDQLRGVVELAIGLGAFDVLVIPEHDGGVFGLSAAEWRQIDEVIEEYQAAIRLCITADAADHVRARTLPTECHTEFVFAHVTADRRLTSTSYDRGGIQIEDVAALPDYLAQLRQQQRRSTDEDLDGVRR